MVLSGCLIRSRKVEGFGANMDHGPGRDQVGAVVVRSLDTVAELEKRVRLLIRVCGNVLWFLYAYLLPFLSRDWTLALRTVLLIERAEGKVKRRSLSVVIHCL